MAKPEEDLIDAGRRLGIPSDRLRAELRKRPHVPSMLQDSAVMGPALHESTWDEVYGLDWRSAKGAPK